MINVRLSILTFEISDSARDVSAFLLIKIEYRIYIDTSWSEQND